MIKQLTPEEQKLSDLFHKLWTANVGKEGYNKNDWLDLVRLLATQGVFV
ncbi:MAG: hypothetical protein V1685_02615 [Parcubacteria group bacterium]